MIASLTPTDCTPPRPLTPADHHLISQLDARPGGSLWSLVEQLVEALDAEDRAVEGVREAAAKAAAFRREAMLSGRADFASAKKQLNLLGAEGVEAADVFRAANGRVVILNDQIGGQARLARGVLKTLDELTEGGLDYDRRIQFERMVALHLPSAEDILGRKLTQSTAVPLLSAAYTRRAIGAGGDGLTIPPAFAPPL